MERIHCNYCNKSIKKNGWSHHIKGKRHLKLFNDFNDNENKKEILLNQNDIIKKLKEENLKQKEVILKLKENLKDKEEIIKLLKQNKKETKTINNTTNNTNNITNNIIINVQGKENIKGIMNPTLYQDLETLMLGDTYNNVEANIPKAINLCLTKFYKPKENRNIDYNNLQSNKCKVLTEQGLITKNINSAIMDRIKECPIMLYDTLEEYTINTHYKLMCKDKTIKPHDWFINSSFNKDIDKFYEDMDAFIKEKGIKKLTDIIDKHKMECYDV